MLRIVLAWRWLDNLRMVDYISVSPDRGMGLWRSWERV